MAEMILLTTETTRRKFERERRKSWLIYVVRTNESQNNVVLNKLGIAATVPINNLVEGGMLQGFITFTTFTN